MYDEPHNPREGEYVPLTERLLEGVGGAVRSILHLPFLLAGLVRRPTLPTITTPDISTFRNLFDSFRHRLQHDLWSGHRIRPWGYLLGGIILILGVVWAISLPPHREVTNHYLHIASGDTASVVAATAYRQNIVAHSRVFTAWLRIFGGNIKQGTYLVSDAHVPSAYTLAWRVTHGDYQSTPVRVYIPEDRTLDEITASSSEPIALANLPDFNLQLFRTLAAPYEGELYPDTYFIYPGTTPEEVLAMLRSTFRTQTDVLFAQSTSTRVKSDIIIMASIVGREAPDTTNRQMVADILWRRLNKGMPLQVDATFWKDNKSPTTLTRTDLATDTPYNTYTKVGLPPGPIGSPNADSIYAALNPTPNDYLFYLTDKQGVFHYAKDYAEHQRNINKYLR